ncbi:MAG TPA: DUF1801 domain-containing protein [Gaiellaceae bacterium]|jgi:uncharacterized protein YdhG (YjbR/CyaY superfamily)|nr:DUF1801 domain-containing protein [Gaiellaceae bacterium]
MARKFTTEEKAAARAALKDAEGEKVVLAAIAKMAEADRKIAERIHAIVRKVAPQLTPRTWYGMPAYSKGDKVVCFFKDAGKFKERYATFGFNDKANLDDGSMWPTSYALTKLTKADEKKIGDLVSRAVSE